MSHIAQKRPFASLVDDDEHEPHTVNTFMTPAEKRFCLQTIKSLFKHKRSIAFHQPVDPIAFNIPDYFDIIKHPMDLSTVDEKLKTDQYPTVEAFVNDIQLIFDNCYLYNNAGDPVTQDAKKLEEAFKKLLKKAPSATTTTNTYVQPLQQAPPAPIHNNNVATEPVLQDYQQQQQQQQQEYRHPLTVKLPVLPTPPPITPVEPVETVELMPDDQLKRCNMVVKELKNPRHKEYSWPFERPVDADAWGASDYYQIIKRPMDMTKYERKLNEFEYAHEDELANDIRLMFQNCYTYNPPGHQINELGKKFEKVFEKYWEKIHQEKPVKEKSSSSSKKRRTSQKDSSSNTTINAEPQMKSTPVQLSAPVQAQIIPPTQPETQNGSITHANNGHITMNHSATNNTAAPPPRSNILRLKLSINKPKEEDTPKVTINKPTAKIPGLALSKEPPTVPNPKLAIGERPPSPPQPVKKLETPNVLKNHDKWLALAANKKPQQQQQQQKPTRPQQQSQLQQNHTNNNIIKKPTLPPPAYIHKETTTRISPPPPPPPQAKPAPIGFDITQITSQIYNGKKVREQEERAKQEKFEREEKIRLEKERIATEEKLQRIREFNTHAKALREKDRAKRMTELNENTIDISKQKMMFHDFERKLRKDNDFVHLYQWHRDTVNYRNIPVPAFVKRSPIKLQDLRAKLLSKCVRLENSKSIASNDSKEENNEGDSDMDVE